MNSKTTGVWFAIAVALAAFIFVYQHWLRPAVFTPAPVLPDLRAAAVTSITVAPPDALEIRVDRTNGVWLLTRPISYPAQTAAIESLLDALQKLTPDTRLSPGDLREHSDAQAEFGLVHPTTLIIAAGRQRWQLKIGHRTTPGNQVYLNLVGATGIFVTDSGWLKFLPHKADDWRDTALVDARPGGFDWIVLTNNVRGLTIELTRDPTNHLWRLIRPLQARADTGHLTDILQRLLSARVAQFVTAPPNTDLTAFGLQPADLELWLGRDGNALAGLRLGRALTNNPERLYIQRAGWDTVAVADKSPLAAWYGPVNSFRDTNLLELTAPVAEIEERGPDTPDFILQRHGSNEWSIASQTFPIDAATVQQFLKALAGLRITQFVRDVVTTPDLPAYGLDKPQREVILRAQAGNTNAVIADLLFGAEQTNQVFVRRADENPVYAISAQDYNLLFGDSGLFGEAWQFRDRHIWDFSPGDVAQITLRQNGKTRELIHDGPDKWSLGPNSQGIIDGQSIERAVKQISSLTADGWLGRGLTNLDSLGFKPDNLQISIALKDGKQYHVDFGPAIADNNGALAATTLDGQRWVFLFPESAYLFVLSYLTIPPNVP